MKKKINLFHSTFALGLMSMMLGIIIASCGIVIYILVKNLELLFCMIFGCIVGLFCIIEGGRVWWKTLYSVTFYKDRIEFSRFSKVHRTFYIDSFRIEEWLILKNDRALFFIDTSSQNNFQEKQKYKYAIDATKKMKKFIEEKYNIKIEKYEKVIGGII